MKREKREGGREEEREGGKRERAIKGERECCVSLSGGRESVCAGEGR